MELAIHGRHGSQPGNNGMWIIGGNDAAAKNFACTRGRGVSQVVQGAFRRPLVGPCKLSEVDGNLVFTWRFGAQILTASQHIPTFLLSFWPFWCVKISWLFRSFTARGCMMEGWGPQKPAVDVTYWETLGWSWLNRGFKMCQRSLAGDDHKLSHVDDLNSLWCIVSSGTIIQNSVVPESMDWVIHQRHTVDGRNPAPVDRWFIPLFIGFQPRLCMISSTHRWVQMQLEDVSLCEHVLISWL